MIMSAAGHAVISRIKPQFLQGIDSTSAVLASFLLLMLTIVGFVELRNAFGRYLSGTRSESAGAPLPGPYGIPILGNVLQMGAAPHEAFRKMAKTYGNVFRIHIGSRMVVVLNGYDAIRQALVKQAVDFAGRPDLTTFKVINNFRGKNIPTLTFSTHSPSWKLHKKIAESTFRHFTSGNQVSCVEQKVTEEASELISYLISNNNGGKEANVIDPSGFVKASAVNILYSFIMNKRRPLDDEHLLNFLSMNQKFERATGSGNPVDFMPWLRFFPNQKLREFKEILAETQDLLADDIAEHQAEYKDGSDRDILDHLITVSRSIDAAERKSTGITEEQILSTVFDLFGAGFSTVSTTLLWVIMYAMKYPDAQQKVQRELDDIVGRDRLPNLSDRGQLPNTEAFILETLRHASVIPFSIPHTTTKDTTLNGYRIPKDTVVFVNLHSVAYDDSKFDDPTKFEPSRFLTSDGTALDPTKTEMLMSFSAGRRRCIGSDLAKVELFLYTSHLMHQCNFATPEGHELNMEPQYGLALSPKPFKVAITPR